MAVYNGSVLGMTPATNDDNWTLRAGASKSLRVLAVHWSGELTSSAALETRIARSSGQSGTASAGNTEKIHPNSPASGVGFTLTFNTTQPVLETGNLIATSWNAHGGIFYWHAGAPDEEFVLIGAATELCVSCRNAGAGATSTSSYGVAWRED